MLQFITYHPFYFPKHYTEIKIKHYKIIWYGLKKEVFCFEAWIQIRSVSK